MTKHTILLYEPDPGQREALVQLLTQWGYRVVSDVEAEEVVDRFEATGASLAIINADASEGFATVAEIRVAAHEVIIIAITSAQSHIRAMEQLKHMVDDFIVSPVAPVALEISLARAWRTFDLLREIKLTCSQDRDAQTCENVAREVDTERFLAVRQMVEKIPAFIADVTASAQGDVEFYNELPYFISVHSPACRVLAANAIYLKYLGNRLYENSWNIYVGKRATRSGCPVGRTAGSGNVLTTRALVRYRSGAKVPVLVHTAPIYDNQGEVAFVLEVFAGTQEIEQLARQIRTTQQRYEQLFNAVPSHVVVLDRYLNITAANRKFKKVFGDHIGQKFYDLFRPAAFPAHRDPISQTYRDGTSHQGEMVLSAPNGRSYNTMAWTNPIQTRTGKMMQVMVIFTDITELRQLKDNLASLGLMVSTVSHDLKGLLTGLDAGLYQIDKGFYRNQPGRIEQGLDTAKLMVDRIRKMVLDVLFSAKERQLSLQTIDVVQFAGDLVAGIETRIRGANIVFNFDLSRCTGQFKVDVDLLRTALINIFENAMEACLESNQEKDYHIDFKAVSQKKEVILEIKDNGPGMPAEAAEAIFSMFHSSKGHKGTGLGMFITDKVVKKHGGTINVMTQINEGTTFVIRLPR
jgi:PAS domain S-box-containing protein